MRSQDTAQAVCRLGRRFVSTALVAAGAALIPAQAGAQQPIALERQVLQFAPSRADLTVGIARVAVFAPDQDWTVKLATGVSENLQTAGKYTFVELKPAGRNRFELPPLAVEASRRDGGPVCVSVKVWFNEVTNVYDQPYYVDPADRNALLSFCTRWDERARGRYGHNRVATLEEFRAGLGRPLPLNLRRNIVPWRPGLFVDGQGSVYFHSLLIGRHTKGTLSHHVVDGWKLGADRKLSKIPVADPLTRPAWPDRVRNLSREPFDALVRIAASEPVARDAAGNLYARFAWCQRDGPPPLNRLARIDARGGCQPIAGSTDGHRDGSASQAQFHTITAVTVGPDGSLYLADGSPDAGSWIRRVTPDGTVATLAGSDRVGLADGPRDAARFHLPSGLAVDGGGNVYVADPVNSRLRKIAPDGVVTTLSATPGDPRGVETFDQPSGVAAGPDGGLYILDGGPKMARVRLIPASGGVQTLVVVDAASRKLAAPDR
jgi:hypothetical protein